MARMDLRPLSLGEVLDRTFTLYRSRFALFLGITAIPQLLVLALRLGQIFLGPVTALQGIPGRPAGPRPPIPGAMTSGASIVMGLVAITVAVVAYLLSQGATVSAVADLYVGGSPTIGGSFSKVRRDLGTLLGVVVLNGLAIMGGFILLVIPGIYIMCRLILAVPAAVIENLGPRDSLERSFALSKGFAGRAFLIILLFFVLSIAAMALFAWPASIGIATSRDNPALLRLWMALSQVLTAVGSTLVTPIFTIAASALYFDLRVRKEALDLQIMLNPSGQVGTVGGVPGVIG